MPRVIYSSRYNISLFGLESYRLVADSVIRLLEAQAL